jgi:hypothetical protein
MPLTFTAGQLEQLADDRLQQFEDRLLAHLALHLPVELQRCGDAWAQRLAVRETIRQGHERGFVTERDLARHSVLCIGLGRDFDLRPEYAPVLAALEGPGSETERLDAAFALAATQDPER